MFDYIIHGSKIVEEQVTLMKFDTDYHNGVHERQQKNVKGGGGKPNSPPPPPPISSKNVPVKRNRPSASRKY